MNKYWVLVRNAGGAPMRVELLAKTNYEAIQIAKSLYGTQLISEGANLC